MTSEKSSCACACGCASVFVHACMHPCLAQVRFTAKHISVSRLSGTVGESFDTCGCHSPGPSHHTDRHTLLFRGGGSMDTVRESNGHGDRVYSPMLATKSLIPCVFWNMHNWANLHFLC